MWHMYGDVNFSQKISKNKLRISFPQRYCVMRTVDGVKPHWLSRKENVLGVAVSKNGHINSLLDAEISLKEFQLQTVLLIAKKMWHRLCISGSCWLSFAQLYHYRTCVTSCSCPWHKPRSVGASSLSSPSCASAPASIVPGRGAYAKMNYMK